MAVTAIKSAKSNLDSFREMVQDFLVPELKSLKVSIDSLRNETRTENESLRTEMRVRDENQMRRSDYISDNIRQLSDKVDKISDKMDKALDVRERLTALEARLPSK